MSFLLSFPTNSVFIRTLLVWMFVKRLIILASKSSCGFRNKNLCHFRTLALIHAKDNFVSRSLTRGENTRGSVTPCEVCKQTHNQLLSLSLQCVVTNRIPPFDFLLVGKLKVLLYIISSKVLLFLQSYTYIKHEVMESRTEAGLKQTKTEL